MEPQEDFFGSNFSETDVRHNRDSFKGDGKEARAGNVQIVSVDKVTVEKIVLESLNGSREVLLTKNETSRKLSLNSETKPNVVKYVKDERQKSASNDRFRVTENAFMKPKDSKTSSQSKLPILKSRKSNGVIISSEESRIKPIKFPTSSSVGSTVIEGSNSTNENFKKKNTVPPKISEKSITKNEHNSSLIETSVSLAKAESSEDLLLKEEKVVDEIVAEVKQEQTEQELLETEDATVDEKGDSISCVEIVRHNETSEAANVNCKRESDEIKKEDDVERRERDARVDRDVRDRLEKSQATIDDLQKNLSTKIHASTARSYKEKLLGLQGNYALKPPIISESSCSERLSSGFDKDFLERHNLDKRLKIEEKRLLETDLDYTSDNDRASETDERPSNKIDVKRKYSEKVTEVEKRWSGEFLDNRLQRNSSESSKSSYVEEFGSVSSRESIVEGRDALVFFDRKHPEAKFTSIDEPKRRTSEEILENSTVSTVDSDSCLEDRIKAVDEDIAHAARGEDEIQTDDNDDIEGSDRAYDDEEDKDCIRWNEGVDRADAIITTTAIVHEDRSSREENIKSDATSVTNDTNSNEVKSDDKQNVGETRNETIADGKNLLTENKNDQTFNSFTVINSKESIEPTTFVVLSHRGKDGYANLVKEFAMEAGSSKVKKEEKQKKKLGFRRLLPAIFSPKDSRKDYKKKEQKERRRYEERHFARYQQNGNYTRSPDTMNLNEDIKRNVKLDNSLNGSIIEERLDEIKRELFPEQGPITSTPDHFLQTDDTRLLRERTRGQRSYTANSSLSSIAPEERWLERSGQFGISPDIRKYEQRQRREEHDSRRYGHLERKHSLQEPNHGGGRTYLFQRNHAASGRISAPPGERYYIRSRAIHPVDRPLPDIPQSRLELSNYENYQDDIDQLCDNLTGLDVADNVDYRSRSGLYQNDRSLETTLIHSPPQSVPAQVKITRQPIVNQNQRAPLIGRSPAKYPSSGSSQKSGDYADSSCTPNSSQKSEFSPTSSKSGEYYLNSPRSSARASPADRPVFEDACEMIYENEGQTSQPSGNYVDEHVYDETPPSPCREDRFPCTETSDRIAENSPEKKDNLIFEQKCSSNQQSPSKNRSFQYCENNECLRTESKREMEKSREDCLKSCENAEANLKSDSLACNQAERSSIQTTSPSKAGTTVATSPLAGSRTRRSQPDDQILIASPKREAICQSRVPRPSNEARFCNTESPVPIADSRDNISGIVPIEVRNQYGGQNSSATGMRRSIVQRSVLSFSKGISRPEPIYGHRGQPSPSARVNAVASETRDGGRENDQLSPPDPYGLIKPCSNVDERMVRVQGRNSTSRSPQSCVLETKQMLNESGRRVARSPIREPSNATQEICPQRRHDATQQQRTSPFTTTASSLEGQRQTSPTANQDKMYISANSLQREPIYEQRQRQYQPQQQQPRQGQELYVQRIADATCGQQSHPTCGLLSPSKQKTRQHLEAFYWQQKALEAHRKSTNSAQTRQAAPKIDLPEMREAVYWQQLKKLDEEQQRRIYEQNSMQDGVYETYHKTSTGSPMMPAALPNQAFGSNATALGPVIHGDGSSWSNVQQRLKMSPTGKPPLMQAQKGQNQPVLIVRPQQALRDRQEMSMKSMNPRDPAGHDAQRSKSASPHFHRGDIERTSLHVTCRKPVAEGRAGTASPARKSEVGGIYEEDGNDSDVRCRPHPIFKRGSLIGGESVEYGSTGPKRVSFSNQPNAGPDLAAGNWPTKRGTAPEPPTRRHKSEDSTSDTDSVFLQQDGAQDASYVTRNAGPSSRCRSDGSCSEQEYDANKPLPPPPLIIFRRGNSARNYACSDARWSNEEQRGSRRKQSEEEWNPDGKGRQSNDTGGSVRGEVEPGSNELTPGRRSGGGGGIGGGGGGGVLGVGAGGGGGGGSGGRSSSGSRSRDEPRRHTLGGDHQPSLHHQQFNAAQQLHPLHPHHLPPPHGQYGTPPSRHTTMDLEMGTKSRQRKSPLPRGYPPPSSTMLFDDDPGIMSEVETSSTGFRRGGKQRSSLPVVRTPSKTLERPLGLVFLQYRNETKRALLPNEITSIDTVKALFVRSFPKQLTMEYLDSPHVKVYIHDSNKDMFYELEDLRSHLRDIRDRSVLRLFESADGVTGMPGPLGVPGGGGGLPPHWEDQSYFSEPEFDSEYQHQHIHKSKSAKNSTSGSYYVGGSSTLPRGGSLLRAYSPAASSVVGGPSSTPTQPKTLTTPDRLHGESGYMSSPERGGGVGSGSGRYPPGPYSAGSSYEDPYYSQYSGTVTPVIDEEARIRVEHMERQLANLTGLVQKALTHAPHTSPSPREYLQVPPGRDPYARAAGAGDEFDKHSSSSSASLPVSQPAVTDDSYLRTDVKPPKLGKDKSVSFEKSVSFSDEPPDMNSPKQHSPQHAADTKPTKPAIKSSTLPRMSSQERDRHKPTPPPKPVALVAGGQYVYRDLALTPEMYNQLRGLQKKAKDLRQEVRNLRRMSQAQAHSVRETIKDTFITIRAMLLSGGDAAWTAGDTEKIRLSREEDLYKQEMIRLEKDLTELESTVEELRGNVINRKTRVNMSDVENMALILSKSSKTVADLKVRFPNLQEGMKGLLSSEMEKVVREEKFLKEEPERLESALRRCKKLTGTLVTLKRLASVQEQRLPNAASVDAEDTPPITPTTAQQSKLTNTGQQSMPNATAPVPAERTVIVGAASILGGGGHPHESSADHQQRPENALDALLDELQTFSRPGSQLGHVSSSLSVHPGSNVLLADIGRTSSLRGDSTSVIVTASSGGGGGGGGGRAPNISDIGRKGSVDSSSGTLTAPPTIGLMGLPGMTPGGTLRRLHSYPSSSDTDTSPPIARLQALSLDQQAQQQQQQQQQSQPGMPVPSQNFLPGQKPPVPERNAELLQLASTRRVPPPPPPRTSSRSPLASPTSPQLPPRNHPCNLQSGNATLRRPSRGNSNNGLVAKEGKPPMALPTNAILSTVDQIAATSLAQTAPGVAPPPHNSSSSQSAVLSTSNSSSCESVNSQEGLQSKRGRQEQLEQRHQELLRKQKALQEQYARLQQLQRNAAGLTTVPPAPPDLLKKTGSESNLLAKMGLGLSTATSGSLTSLSLKPQVLQDATSDGSNQIAKIEIINGQAIPTTAAATTNGQVSGIMSTMVVSGPTTTGSATTVTTTSTTTTSKVYETDIL